MRLGDIRRWHTRFHLYAAGADERMSAAVADWTRQAKGIVIVEKQPGDSDATARVVVQSLAHGRPLPHHDAVQWARG